MGLILDVPGRRQHHPNGCWHVAASMVLEYYGRMREPFGSAWYVPQYRTYEQLGLPANEYPNMASWYGLQPLPERPRAWTSEGLQRTLTGCGPLWYDGGHGRMGHVVVVIGICDKAVHYNDPYTGGTHRTDLDTFNGWMHHSYRTADNPLHYPAPGNRVRRTRECP